MSPCVLVVDDDLDLALTLTVILRQQGYVCSAVTSGEEALQHISAHVPDLLISDVMMPGIDGISLADRVKRHHPQCKVLLCTGNSMISSPKYTILFKPITVPELLSNVRNVLGTVCAFPSAAN